MLLWWGAVCHASPPVCSTCSQKDCYHWVLIPQNFFSNLCLVSCPACPLHIASSWFVPIPCHGNSSAGSWAVCFVSSLLHPTERAQGNACSPGVWACTCCWFHGQLGTSAGKFWQQALTGAVERDAHRVLGSWWFLEWEGNHGNMHLATATLLALPVPLRLFFGWAFSFLFLFMPLPSKALPNYRTYLTTSF